MVDKKMVCLFGIALQATTEKNVTSKFWNDFTSWNWLVHDLTNFIYSKSSETKPAPHIPESNDTVWGIWFNKVLSALKKEFYDANEILTFRVLENCPTEEVALMIFNTIEIRVIMEFLTTCLLGAG